MKSWRAVFTSTVISAITASSLLLYSPAAFATSELKATLDLSSAGKQYSQDFPFGGISGLDHIEGSRYIALSDDRSDKGPARAYFLNLSKQQPITGELILQNPQGKEYPKNSVDPEAIRILPDGSLLWSSEGSAKTGIPPAIIIANAEGKEQSRFTIPFYHRPFLNQVGVQDNKAYEGLTLEKGSAFVLAEGPLNQDRQSNVTRLTQYDLATGTPRAEFAYPLDAPPEGSHERGATEILSVGEGKFITLERSYVEGSGTRAKVYLINIAPATDILGKFRLTGEEVTVEKQLILDLTPHGEDADNTESLAWGDFLPDGRRELLIGTDDNFNEKQRTLIHRIALDVDAL